jgi:hypothetical protein
VGGTTYNNHTLEPLPHLVRAILVDLLASKKEKKRKKLRRQ